MPAAAIVEALLALGRTGDWDAIGDIPGAGEHGAVLQFSDTLRSSELAQIQILPVTDRVAFAKALAVYESTVGGLGSVTALELVLPLIPDEDHALLDWILSKTRSYWYYSHGAVSYADLQAMRAAHARRRAENEAREADRTRHAMARRGERASANLFNAVRRGDVKAVRALLHQGANPNGVAPNGMSLLSYAEENSRHEIAELLRQAPSGASAA